MVAQDGGRGGEGVGVGSRSASTGTVFLVGAGPGDPGLLTLRGLTLLRDCDAIVHDALVNPAILAQGFLERTRAAEVYDVGKRGGDDASAHQGDISDLLVRLAREGKRVVRLKGGDPFVFGRGSEEALSLAKAAVAFEVVPGVTAGVAASAYAGIPVTHRSVATSVTFVTGHEDPNKNDSSTDWTALARTGGTLVLYMGMSRLADVTSALLGAGMPAEMPLAMVEWGTYPRQRVVVATVATAAECARSSGVRAPSIAIIGEVVRLREHIEWFEKRPLFGRRVVVTRARSQASGLAAALADAGADVLEFPVIRIEPINAEALMQVVSHLGDYDWLVFTSQNAVARVWNVLRERGLDARAFCGSRLCAVGPATASALEARGLVPDVVPSRFLATHLVECMSELEDVRAARIFFARAEGASDVIANGLRAIGATVDDLAAYRTVPDDAGALELCARIDNGEVDLVTFSSGSTVHNFVAAVGVERARRVRAVSIGPVTSAAAGQAGIDVTAEASEATIPALVAAAVRALPG
ncbi:MAG: uroporphyrinogen-III C-methyltransferase [Gemmatimonadaceae bacterium]